ncbi:MAG: bifunctional (p)ppGpp synthetase/guanosine-3',5'-bis(diphosphate) 3'-pyrophosphohydrolase [Thermoleophilia bacterium]|jgi:GTP pyrophosphokinase|nr:bifunctional (p)ppGpp synthetase/guanosine-3',5'-bis(diphosphate) 3'-pyrophosphohydrolase [Thermoleophilia bacterium]
MSKDLADLDLALGSDVPELEQVIAEVAEHHADVDRDALRRAYAFAEEHHRTQVRNSGEPFITHPLGCARIAAGLGLDGTAVVAALLHDTVEDTSATLEEIEAGFGAEIAALVDGVTKLSKIHFESQEAHQAENYRKLIVSMSSDIRVLVVKLADRLHNMRTLAYMTKPKQIQKAKETLEIYAPLAHRLGIHSLKWELEDLAFATLHPRRYSEIQQMVNQRRPDREAFIEDAGRMLATSLEDVGILGVEITGRAKHFYSIYEKMTRKGKEFNEIYDLTAMRVLVDSVKDCYGAVGIIHSLWKPLPGRFKDYIAMPKLNMYQSLHTTVIGPEGKPLEIQIRTYAMHATAEFGVAAHWLYKQDGTGGQPAWVSRMMDWQKETHDPGEFLEALRSDLYSDEVYVFTPKGEVRDLPVGATPLDFAYDVHTDVGHRCVGAKVNGRIVPLTYTLQSGDFVEILTSKAARAPSRDWLQLVTTTKARSKISQFFRRERREDAEHRGRESLQDSLRKAGLPSQRVAGSPLLLEVIQEMGFKKADEFYISLGLQKTSVQVVVNKIMQRLKAGQAVVEDAPAGVEPRGRRPHTSTASSDLGIEIDGLADVLVRLAKCCKPVPGDPILGYISLGRGITIHREDCPNAKALKKNPERFTPVTWTGVNQQSFRVEIAIDAWDRARLLEDLSRAFAEAGVNIVSANASMEDQMVHDRFVVEVGDIETLKSCINGLRQVESVFDAYRVTPGN